MLMGSGKADADRAMRENDKDFFTYGRRDPPPNGARQALQLPPHIAEIPSLPTVHEYSPTGDPAVDERRLQEFLSTNGTDEQREALRNVLVRRDLAMKSRQAYMDYVLAAQKK